MCLHIMISTAYTSFVKVMQRAADSAMGMVQHAAKARCTDSRTKAAMATTV